MSVSNNLAKGFDRSSDVDFPRFLYLSLAYCSEVKSMLYLAERLSYIIAPQKENYSAKPPKSPKSSPASSEA
ncbi:MAG TPA: hypothetical protein DCR46_06630 [Cytophagales bacterium]|nr:hypothetical protein [Cytophagales bacterium]